MAGDKSALAATEQFSFDLAKRPKGDGRKVQMALQLREQTVMTMEWVNGLQMRTRTYLNHLLYWHHRGKAKRSE